MAIMIIPLVGLKVLEHAAGGAILAGANGYIAGTYVGPAVAHALGTASSVLGAMGAGVGAAGAAPVAGAALAVAAIAAGGYCYFYGLPVPIEAALAKAGLGAKAAFGGKAGVSAATAGKALVAVQPFAVPVASLAVALVLLGGAGYVTYRFCQTPEEAEADAASAAQIPVVELDENGRPAARSAAESAFGTGAWSRFGEALWSGLGDAAEKAAKLAAEAVDIVSEAGSATAEKASEAASTAYDAAQDAASRIGREGSTLLDRLKSLFRRDKADA